MQKGRREVQKCQYLENERSFLSKIKSIFHNLLSAIVGEISENSGHTF